MTVTNTSLVDSKLAEESTESTCLSEEDIEDVDKTMVRGCQNV
jgi:hypothetical protein